MSITAEELLTEIDEQIEVYGKTIKDSGYDVTIEQLESSFEKAAEQAGHAAIDFMMSNRQTILDKCAGDDVPESMRKSISVLFDLMEGSLKKGSVVSVESGEIAAIIISYFLNPFDLIPDFDEECGYLDDEIFLLFGIKKIAADFIKHCEAADVSTDIIFL